MKNQNPKERLLKMKLKLIVFIVIQNLKVIELNFIINLNQIYKKILSKK